MSWKSGWSLSARVRPLVFGAATTVSPETACRFGTLFSALSSTLSSALFLACAFEFVFTSALFVADAVLAGLSAFEALTAISGLAGAVVLSALIAFAAFAAFA